MRNSAATADSIEASHASLAKHLVNAEFDAIGLLFCEHGRLLAPNMPTIVGRDNIRQFWHAAKAISSLSFQTRSLRPLGIDTVREIGDLRIVLHAEAGRAASELPNKYLFVWQKIGEEWKIESAIWNRVTPGHPPPTGPRLGASAPDRDLEPEQAPFVPIVG